jgi:hypothetical protein
VVVNVNIKALSIGEELSTFFCPFPERSSSVIEKRKATEVWEKILLKGEGFVGDHKTVLGKDLEIFLKDKSQCNSNFVSFCDRFWGTIEPKNEEKKKEFSEEALERLFVIFKVFGKKYLEEDASWLGFRPFASGDLGKDMDDGIDQLSDLDITSLSSLSALGSKYLKGCAANLRDSFIPWSLFTVPAAYSRYRTARQCSLGLTRLTNKWKENSSVSAEKIKTKYEGFLNIFKNCSPNFFKNDGKIERDQEKTITEIKDLQAFRIASTVLKVCLLVALCGPFLFYVPYILSPILPEVISYPVAFIAQIVGSFIVLASKGTGKQIMDIFTMSGINLLSLIMLTEAVCMTYLMMFASVAVANFAIVFLLPICFVLLAAIFPIAHTFSANFSLSSRKLFYENDLQNDDLSFILKPLTWAIKAILEMPLYLIDGAEQKV